jgi:hypothetical protein
MAGSPSTREQSTSRAKTIQNIYRAHALEMATSIRVLDILPVPTGASEEARIKSTLRAVDLDHEQDFDAKSYVWGTYATQRHSILCDRMRFEVTSNGHSALW